MRPHRFQKPVRSVKSNKMNYIQQAYKGENSWWRYFITLVIVMSPFILNFLIYFLLPEIFEQLMSDVSNFNGNKNVFLIQNLIPFLFLLGFLFLFVKFLHNRSLKTLVTSRDKIDWKRFFYGFFIWGIISVLMIFISYLINPDAFIWNFKLTPFLYLIIISIILIPIQTSFEELLFRGYLMQGLGILTKNRWFPLIVTSVLFGLMHSLNPEVDKLGFQIMIYYIGTGFLFGIITLMDEGTELALGLHAINNIIAATLVTSNWMVFNTDALFIDTSEPEVDLLMYLPVFVIYPIVIFIFSKKYGWKNWKDKLFGKIEKPLSLEENN